ncbi:MAG TPA: methyl-accepting chemotaxis protein [Anaeromyxobacteraceae bacterium]|nr:methyl-accepting chemotaxis protein [Anaeromyxobacteraceae bacterium]
MGEVRTRNKVLAGFGAALCVALLVGVSSYLASREIGHQLALVSDSQFPMQRALSGVEVGFQEAHAFLSHLALSSRNPVLRETQDCRACHDGADIFGGRADESIARVERAMSDFDGLPHTEAATHLWPKVRSALQAWLGDARDLRASLAERDRLLSSAAPGPLKAVETRAFDQWRKLHNQADAIEKLVGELSDAVKAEAVRSHEAGKVAEGRQIYVQAGVLALGALLTLAIGFVIGRTVDRAIAALVGEASKMTSAATRGELEVRGDEKALPTEFRPVVQGMNATLDAFVPALRLSIHYVDQVSRGEVPARIEEPYQGEFKRMKDSWNELTAVLQRRSEDVRGLTEAAVAGRLHVRADPGRYRGHDAELIAGINALLDRVVEPLDAAAAYVDRLSKGDVPPPFTTPWAGDLDLLRESLNRCSSAVGALVADAHMLVRAAAEGRLSTRADASRHHGDFRLIVQGVNDTLDAVIGPLNVAARCVSDIARGAIPPKIAETYAGDFNAIKDNLNRCIEAVNALVADANVLATAAVEGRLDTRVEAGRHEGDFRKVVDGVNRTLDALLAPVKDATLILERLAEGDLTARVDSAYRGDHARVKQALNKTAGALNRAMVDVARAVDQVSSASSQIAQSSQAVAEGATEQASSLEETRSQLESLSSTTRQSADRAGVASTLAEQARESAGAGAGAMDRMTSAMARIKVSAQGTSEIIKDINEISFQTNLLALNAAVEAARAGEAGRGFAVVAEEVRSLAMRAKEAATRTEELIRSSVNEAGEGEATAREVREQLAAIAGSVTEVSDIVAEITANARGQAVGIDELGKAVAEMDKVTQQNAATSEESSSAAVELSDQAKALAALVAAFRVDAEETADPSAGDRRRAGRAPVRGASAANPSC